MQLTRTEILNKLKEILISIDEKNADKIKSATEDSKLLEDLGLTSVGMLYLVIVIEESFSVRFDNIGMDEIKTVKDTIDLIEKASK